MPIGFAHMRAGDVKAAVEVLKLVLLAYPESADANETLADAYLADGQKELRDSTPKRHWFFLILTGCRRHHGPTRSSFAVRFVRSAQKILTKLGGKQGQPR